MLTGDRVKIRIEGWLNDIAHYASSGTRRNIYCVNATATISPTFSATPTITPTHTITKTHTISPTATVTPVNTPSLELVLRGIYPNPVRKGCEIVFYLSRKADVKACFYSVDGSRVAVIRKTAEAGEQRLVWKREISGGNMVPPGVYICVVEAVAYADKAIARLKAVVY